MTNREIALTETNDTIVSMPISTQQAASLLNQQIWCWGRDIEYSNGNLLMKKGFQRVEKPKGSTSASLYLLNLSSTSRVILRGFGIFFGDDRLGGIFIRRFDFKPQFTPEANLSRPPWAVEDLPRLASPSTDQISTCQRMLLMLIDWIREYEVWIAEQVGIAYRTKTMIDWNEKHGMAVPAEEITLAWQMLENAVSDNPERWIKVIQ